MSDYTDFYQECFCNDPNSRHYSSYLTQPDNKNQMIYATNSIYTIKNPSATSLNDNIILRGPPLNSTCIFMHTHHKQITPTPYPISHIHWPKISFLFSFKFLFYFISPLPKILTNFFYQIFGCYSFFSATSMDSFFWSIGKSTSMDSTVEINGFWNPEWDSQTWVWRGFERYASMEVSWSQKIIRVVVFGPLT